MLRWKRTIDEFGAVVWRAVVIDGQYEIESGTTRGKSASTRYSTKSFSVSFYPIAGDWIKIGSDSTLKAAKDLAISFDKRRK